mgnify:CR=1 FL=1
MRTEKLERYREERRRYLAKLDSIQAHIKELDRKITECENLEIRALMKTESMTLADLMAMVREMQEQRRAPYPPAGDAAYQPSVDNGGDTAYHGDANDEEENETNEEI